MDVCYAKVTEHLLDVGIIKMRKKENILTTGKEILIHITTRQMVKTELENGFFFMDFILR